MYLAVIGTRLEVMKSLLGLSTIGPTGVCDGMDQIKRNVHKRFFLK